MNFKSNFPMNIELLFQYSMNALLWQWKTLSLHKLSDFDFEVLAPLPCSCIETNYLRTRLTDATSRSSSRHRASRDQLPETTTRRIRRTAGVSGRQTCGRCRRPSQTMLHWTALQNALRRNERRSARACNYSSINTMHFGIDTMYKYSHSCR